MLIEIFPHLAMTRNSSKLHHLPQSREVDKLSSMMNEQNPETQYNTGFVAQWVNTHENTVRGYSKRYSSFLSAGANNPKRRFTYEDVRVIATIADARNMGLTLDDIETKILKQGKLLENDKMPPMPNPELNEARKQVDFLQIPKERYDLELLEIEVKNEVKILTAEKDRLERELEETTTRLETELKTTSAERDELRTKVIVLERDISAAKERLAIIEQERKPFTWWLSIIAIIVIAALVIAAIALIYFISTLGLGSA